MRQSFNLLDASVAFENIAAAMPHSPSIQRSAARHIFLTSATAGALTLAATLAACQREAAPEPTVERAPAATANVKPVEKPTSPQATRHVDPSASVSRGAEAGGAATTATTSTSTTSAVKAAPGDPMKGTFTLADATKGLSGRGELQATIRTDQGDLLCDLYEDKAPITVANFVGLARGTRPWKKDGKWQSTPLYDGTVFHRVVKNFMIQGGDPNKNGSGGPGYEIPDEVWDGAKHDQRGLLCMANRGKDTNGSQFFILDGKASHLDGGYTIFGKCGPDALVEKLASVPVRGQSAVNPTVIKTIDITRKK